MEEARDQAPKTFEELRPKELAGVDVTFESTTGIPAQVILERARETGPDLIVMSTHGWTGFRHLILGSVAERIVQGAPCSILTVRPPRTDGE
jgi:nucleotide-binding universal stress UspA family protein